MREHLVQIRMGYSYLRNVLKFKFPELRQQQAQREAEAAAREVRTLSKSQSMTAIGRDLLPSHNVRSNTLSIRM